VYWQNSSMVMNWCGGLFNEALILAISVRE